MMFNVRSSLSLLLLTGILPSVLSKPHPQASSPSPTPSPSPSTTPSNSTNLSITVGDDDDDQYYQMQWQMHPTLGGTLRGIPYFMTMLLNFHDMAKQDWQSSNPEEYASFPPYHQYMRLRIGGRGDGTDGWGGDQGLWKVKLVTEMLHLLLKVMVAKPGLVKAGYLRIVHNESLETRAEIYLYDPSVCTHEGLHCSMEPPPPYPPLSQGQGQGNGTLDSGEKEEGGEVVETMRLTDAFTPNPTADGIVLQASDVQGYESWPLGADHPDAAVSSSSSSSSGNSSSGLTFNTGYQFRYNWDGPMMLPSDWFQAVIDGILYYASSDGSTRAKDVGGDVVGAKSRITISQYWPRRTAVQNQDKIMTADEALEGLRQLAEESVAKSKWQTVTMVMEREPGKPIGIFKVAKATGNNPVSGIAALSGKDQVVQTS